MKPVKKLDLLYRYYYIQMRLVEEMWDAYSAHDREDESDMLYSLFMHEYVKDELEDFWKKFEPHYCEAIALRDV